MSIRDDVIRILVEFRDKQHGGHAEKAAAALGVSAPTFSRWVNGVHIPKLETLLPVFEQLRAKISLPGEENAREVCFVDSRVVPAGEGHTPPQVEDYLAVPMVAEVGAGPGIIPQNEVLSWFLVWRHQRAVSTKRDLIAVQIGKQSTSMVPTLNPLDIVLVDRQDRDVQNPGKIMLVMDEDGAGKIKRVAVERQAARRDFRITYYSDNAAHNPPEVYSLREHFSDDWDRAIVGRVVWAWSDVTGK